MKTTQICMKATIIVIFDKQFSIVGAETENSMFCGVYLRWRCCKSDGSLSSWK